MATLTRGATYSTTETITNTKLHNLVDLGSVSQIVDADISSSANIADTKLADITTGGKVRGSALLNLQSLVSAAGQIPIANIPVLTPITNIPVLGSTMVSLVTIPNTSLLPINLSSWVDGISLKNLASIPVTTGQFNYKTIVSSLASGSFPKYDGSNNFIGGVVTVTKNTDYSFSATKSGTQSALSGTQQITFDTEDFDTGSNYASDTFTAPISGKYFIGVNLYILETVNSAQNQYIISLYKNGSPLVNIGGSTINLGSSTDVNFATSGSIILSLAQSDTITVYVTPSAGATNYTVNTDSHFWGYYLT